MRPKKKRHMEAIKRIEKKVKEFFLFLQRYKGKDGYTVPYYNEHISIDISDKDAERIIKFAIILMDEVERLGEEGLLSKEAILNRHKELHSSNSDDNKDITFTNIITGFCKGGIYDYKIFNEVYCNVSEAIGYDKQSGFFELFGKFKVHSAMLSVIEGYFINEDKEHIYEVCIWMFIRSCLYLKFDLEMEISSGGWKL